MGASYSHRALRIARALREPVRERARALSLANKPDPLDELVFIILTTMTQFGPLEAFDALKLRFPTWQDLLKVGAEGNLREVIGVCGLVNQKAPQIIGIAARLNKDFGAVTLAPLAEMNDSDAEAYLLSLPRVGKKVARCVLMYSFGRNVLPVDAHVLRVSKRVGLLPDGISWAQAHESIHEKVPPNLRHELHVGLVVHGRDVCIHRNPKCDECVLKAESLCPGMAH